MQVSRARFGAEVVVSHPVSCTGPQDTLVPRMTGISTRVTKRTSR